MVQKMIYLVLAGGAGTLARYLLSGFMQKSIAADFPLGTAVVNILGCLLFGLIWAILESRVSLGGQMRIVIFVGFFGAFTTFSSFMFETARLLDQSQWLWASANIVLQNILGMAAVITGLAIGKMI